MSRTICVLLITVLGFAAASVQAGEAKSTSTVRLNRPYDEVVAWCESNQKSMYKAANCEILHKKDPHTLLVRTKSPLGLCTYWVQQQKRKTEGQTEFEVKLTEHVSGRIMDQQTVIQVQDHMTHTQVVTTIYVDFRHRLASPRLVKRNTDRSVDHTKKLLISELDPSAAAEADVATTTGEDGDEPVTSEDASTEGEPAAGGEPDCGGEPDSGVEPVTADEPVEEASGPQLDLGVE
jgi:hypothetical protein